MRRASLTLLRTQSDDRLVALARAGNEQAFEAIVERYRRPLLRHGRRLLPDASAEDAVQQAMLAAWTALRRGDDVRELSAWLHRILHNVALNAIRGASKEAHAELPDSLSSAHAPDEEIERRMAVRTTLAGVAALPERQREALLRTAVEGRSQNEVALALGLSHGAVAQLVMRGRRTLRDAATALTPPWLIDWLAALGTSGAGAARVAAVVVVAGTAVSGPVLTHRDGERPRQVAEARADRAPDRPRDGDARPAAPAGGGIAAPGDGPAAGGPGASGPGSGRSGSGRAESSGPGSGGPDSSGPGSGGSDTGGSDSSGPGSGGTDSGGSDSSGPGSGGSDTGGSDSSGPGSGGSDSGESDSSGPGSGGSGSSGSGTSGSGSSGSGSSGSGSSGSGSSGSGSSGSGSSGSGTSGSGSSGSGSSGSGSSDSGSSSSGSSGSGSGDSEPDAEPEDSSGSGSSGSGSGDDDD